MEAHVVNSDKNWRRTKLTAGAVGALGIWSLGHPITALADVVAPILVVAPGVLAPPTTEITPGGTVILRGSRPSPPAIEPAPERSPINYPSTAPVTPPPGFDNRFDAGGIDQNFDRSGLTRP